MQIVMSLEENQKTELEAMIKDLEDENRSEANPTETESWLHFYPSRVSGLSHLSRIYWWGEKCACWYKLTALVSTGGGKAIAIILHRYQSYTQTAASKAFTNIYVMSYNLLRKLLPPGT